MVRWKRLGSVSASAVDGRSVVVALGVLYVALAVGWGYVLVSRETSSASLVLVSLLIGGPGIVLLYGGSRLPETDIRPEFYATVAGRSLIGLGVMVTILGLYHLQPDDSLAGSFQTVLILTALSTVAGFGIGINDAQARSRAFDVEERNRELERTRSHVEERNRELEQIRSRLEERNGELQRTQAELEETVSELAASNERLEQFAYAASHDLQEPLRMVSSYLQLIERRADDELSEEAEEFLAYAVDGAERMRGMIEGLLEYSRVETQGEPVEPVELDDVLADVRTDLRMRIEESDAEITADSLPRVQGDAGQLRQVFQNLLSNAIEYSGDEPPQVDITAERRSEATWTVSVRDDGLGIDPADQDRVFEVFERLHSRADHAGTGIGLALCQRIVERHGGEIRVDSEPGEGATFSFTLPAVDEQEG
ncbi:ATP-binding protein [Halobacteria archaeon AArc-m2/3/4]|uniref:histidine kinase n=1 Tax=Natronoglomus mannanivorans TaxID=2979990 RepID=A0ABT2QAJ5_9EURY|nr:ATP-binding protein [Halobacteria archaeon AArc-m2/3/4]